MMKKAHIEILQKLEEIHRMNMLEETKHKSSYSCFLSGTYHYNKYSTMNIWVLKNFINLLKSCSTEKFKVIIMNIQNRFDGIKRYTEMEIPF